MFLSKWNSEKNRVIRLGLFVWLIASSVSVQSELEGLPFSSLRVDSSLFVLESIKSTLVDEQGNVYIGGYKKTDHGMQWTLARFNTNGTVAWLLDLQTFGHSLNKIQLGTDGWLYVAAGTVLLKIDPHTGIIVKDFSSRNYVAGRTS